jgi:hypothetical protein
MPSTSCAGDVEEDSLRDIHLSTHYRLPQQPNLGRVEHPVPLMLSTEDSVSFRNVQLAYPVRKLLLGHRDKPLRDLTREHRLDLEQPWMGCNDRSERQAKPWTLETLAERIDHRTLVLG